MVRLTSGNAMIALACAIAAVVILAYSAFALRFVQSLPERDDGLE